MYFIHGVDDNQPWPFTLRNLGTGHKASTNLGRIFREFRGDMKILPFHTTGHEIF